MARYVLLIFSNSTRAKTCFEDLLQRSCTMLLRMKIATFKRSCARRVFLREKRSRFLGQEKFEQGQFNTTSSPAISASQLASKSTSQKTVKPTASKQPATHHHNTATQEANHPADQHAETSQPKASSSNHPVIQSAIEPTQSRAP